MTDKILLFSHSGFSDANANGITMKNLLSAWPAEQKAEFFCDVQPPDFTAAHQYFRVTDVQAVKALLGKKSRHIFAPEPESGASGGSQRAKTPARIPGWLKKHKYNFVLKWLREWLWQISPWGHRSLRQWISEVNPDVIFYMVGESLFLDKLVLDTCQRTGKPLVLYNGEAYRIIDLKTRRGLERAYYRRSAALYEKLCRRASLVIYNSEMLREGYEARYPETAAGMVAYNTALCDAKPYVPNDPAKITYFGNLGVGRSDVLLQVADILENIDPKLSLNIYGNAPGDYPERFRARENITYHGFVSPEALKEIMDSSDILLHVESFDPDIAPKLRYAFSTKLAQCLCAGRCFVSYAPAQSASSRYLAESGGCVMVSSPEELTEKLRALVSNPALRNHWAQQALRTGRENHDMSVACFRVREAVEQSLNGGAGL